MANFNLNSKAEAYNNHRHLGFYHDSIVRTQFEFLIYTHVRWCWHFVFVYIVVSGVLFDQIYFVSNPFRFLLMFLTLLIKLAKVFCYFIDFICLISISCHIFHFKTTMYAISIYNPWLSSLFSWLPE